jgi:hypothetical protein
MLEKKTPHTNKKSFFFGLFFFTLSLRKATRKQMFDSSERSYVNALDQVVHWCANRGML